MGDFRVIDYDHTRDGFLCNGSLSSRDGIQDAIWRFGEDGQPPPQARLLRGNAFQKLWDGIDFSVAHRGVFWRYLVTDPTRPVDPELDHVIVLASELDGRGRYMTFLVPADVEDAEFTLWLDALDVPTTTREPAKAA